LAKSDFDGAAGRSESWPAIANLADRYVFLARQQIAEIGQPRVFVGAMPVRRQGRHAGRADQDIAPSG